MYSSILCIYVPIYLRCYYNYFKLIYCIHSNILFYMYRPWKHFIFWIYYMWYIHSFSYWHSDYTFSLSLWIMLFKYHLMLCLDYTKQLSQNTYIFGFNRAIWLSVWSAIYQSATLFYIFVRTEGNWSSHTVNPTGKKIPCLICCFSLCFWCKIE